ncbi:MAG: YceI family protein [Candidatus Sulfotelmatobacter sp.]
MSTVEVAVRYLIDAKRSKFTVKAFATGLLSALGHSPTIAIPDFEGNVSLTPDDLTQSSLRVVIPSASLNVIDDIKEKDRQEINRAMRDEVLESDAYPDIVYECSKVSASKLGEDQFQVTLNGDLTLHGVTQNEPVSARVWLNGDTLRAAGDFSARQSDYEIRPVSAAGGTIKLKDELKMSFDISARKQA